MSGVVSTGPMPATDNVAERYVFWYVALIPLWWAFGMVAPLGMVGVTVLFLRNLPRDPATWLISGLWMAAGLGQCIAAIVNWAWQDLPVTELPRLTFSFTSLGWVLLGMSLAVGRQAGLASPRIVRSICCWMIAVLVLGATAFAVSLVIPIRELIIPSPIALMLPAGMRTATQQFSMNIFLREEFMDSEQVRLVLFFPWANGLGLASAAALLVVWREQDLRWRWAAIAGGALGLILSYSRSAMVAMLVAAALVVFLRVPRGMKLAGAIGAGVLFNAMAMTGWDPYTAFTELYQSFSAARAGSSEARELIAATSWHRFLDSPVVGYGWFSEPFARWLRVPLGSHSTIYGTPYTGGLLTFVPVVLGYAATLAMALGRLLDGDSEGSIAVAILLVIGMMSYGENINTLVPSLLVVFLWLGGALRSPHARAPLLDTSAVRLSPLHLVERRTG
jgi:hypothetical protein